MKNKVLKAVVTMGVVAVLSACGDDPAGPNPGPTSSTSNDPCASVVAISDAWLFTADQTYVIYPDGKVTDAAGNVVGQFAEGVITALGGTQIAAGVDVGVLKVCPANATVNPDGSIVPNSSAAVVPGSSADVGPASSADVLPGSSAVIPGSSAAVDPNSSAAVDPNSSGSVVPGSSADVVPESSSSKEPDLDENGFPTLESYGDPPAEYTKDILSNGKTGWSSRYWDACKPHCSIRENVDASSEEAYIAGRMTARNCNVHDVEIPTFVLSSNVSIYYLGYEGTPSACTKGDATGSFTCTDMAPIQVTENLSYGYVAAPGAQFGGGCGKCFHLQFNGGNHANDVKETHKALKGKHMIVMASNIGYDVEAGQYDMLVPGGGVGAFNALSTQIGVPASGLGANGGGFLTECQSSLGWDNTVEAYQQCVIKKCDEVFKDWPNLLRGCHWFAEWYMAADNPTYNWEEVECPQYLIDHYTTTINTSKENNYKQQADWSTYKKGDALDTLHCWREGVNPRDPNGGPGCDP